MWKRLFLDKWTLHLDAPTIYRQSFTEKFFIRGPIRTLNVGTGGGIETLRLLHKGNLVTVIELDRNVEIRTRERAERNGFADKYKGIVAHFLQAELEPAFDQIVMCEVLEHIKDDRAAIRKIANLLAPGGRLILSTPTALYGQMMMDQISLTEDGGHVRVGYQGPELDLLLEENGLLCIKRFYLLNYPVRVIHAVDRILGGNRWTRPLASLWALGCRPFMPLLDSFEYMPMQQLTIAVRLKQREG